MNRIFAKYLFNFGASYSGGGLKRLTEYVKWYNLNGGAQFIIRSECSGIEKLYPNNKYFVINQNKFERFFNDCGYIDDIIKEVGFPDVYYSYGIPMYKKFGKVNWFHISNVLPLVKTERLISFPDSIKIKILGLRIKRYLSNCSIISAESEFSLTLLKKSPFQNYFISVNGSDDELNLIIGENNHPQFNFATVVGTYKYKCLEDAYYIFNQLQINEPSLKFVIIGNDSNVPKHIKQNLSVITKNILPRSEVVEILSSSKYYISATKIENSYNAASEGIFLASESIISDIGPHFELLKSSNYKTISYPFLGRSFLIVKNTELNKENLKYWNQIIEEMNEKIMHLLNQQND